MDYTLTDHGNDVGKSVFDRSLQITAITSGNVRPLLTDHEDGVGKVSELKSPAKLQAFSDVSFEVSTRDKVAGHAWNNDFGLLFTATIKILSQMEGSIARAAFAGYVTLDDSFRPISAIRVSKGQNNDILNSIKCKSEAGTFRLISLQNPFKISGFIFSILFSI